MELRNDILIAGVDEVGRGPLAGPVVAAAVIFSPEAPQIDGLRDSKQLSEARRDALYDEIITNCLSYAIGAADVDEIDSINILQASMLAMQRAVENLDVVPEQILVDGNRKPLFAVETHAIIKGDQKIPVISAASIVAKVTRDRQMVAFDEIYPHYGFAKHKGYGTALHLESLRKYGASPIHRQSFAPVRDVMAQ